MHAYWPLEVDACLTGDRFRASEDKCTREGDRHVHAVDCAYMRVGRATDLARPLACFDEEHGHQSCSHETGGCKARDRTLQTKWNRDNVRVVFVDVKDHSRSSTSRKLCRGVQLLGREASLRHANSWVPRWPRVVVRFASSLSPECVHGHIGRVAADLWCDIAVAACRCSMCLMAALAWC
jgi:hypothetical protein